MESTDRARIDVRVDFHEEVVYVNGIRAFIFLDETVIGREPKKEIVPHRDIEMDYTFDPPSIAFKSATGVSMMPVLEKLYDITYGQYREAVADLIAKEL